MLHTLDSRPFANRTGAGVTVAVIDSGIHPAHPHVGVIDGGISLVEASADHADRLGHGTAVAAAIREKAPAACILAVKVFHDRLATNAETLARAIEWAAHEGARVINLSLGTRNAAHRDRLTAAVDAASAAGAIVVSALGTTDEPWYPGSLAGVAGVMMDASMERDELRIEARDDNLPIFAASPYPRPIPDVPREQNVSGISFAVANVSGFLSRALEGAPADQNLSIVRALTDAPPRR